MKTKKLLFGSIVLLLILAASLYVYTSATAKVDPDELNLLIKNISNGEEGKVIKAINKNRRLLKAETEEGRRPLEYAIAYQKYSIANDLLEKKAAISETSTEPLFVQLALSLNDSIQLESNPEMQREVVSLFKTAIKQDKEQLEETDDQGNTALHFTALKGNDELVELLLEEGISPASTNQSGETALSYAVQSGQTKVCEQLIKVEPELTAAVNEAGYSLLISAVLNNRTDIISMLLSEKVEMDAKDQEEKTALMYASEFGNSEVVDKLLTAGADPEIKSKEGVTAFGYATEGNHKEVINLLTDKSR